MSTVTLRICVEHEGPRATLLCTQQTWRSGSEETQHKSASANGLVSADGRVVLHEVQRNAERRTTTIRMFPPENCANGLVLRGATRLHDLR